MTSDPMVTPAIRNPPSAIKQHAFAVILITLVVAVVGLFDGGGRDLLNTMEAGFVLTSHEFARDGHWIVPTQDGEPRTVKPPLPFWMAAGAEMALSPLGVEPLVAMRILSAAMGAVVAIFIYLLGCQMFDRKAGLFAAIVWASSMQSAMEFRYARHDIYLAAFCAMAVLGIWRAWQKQRFGWAITAVGLILAFQAKGPICWALVVLPAIIWALLHRPIRWRYIGGLIGLILLSGVLLLPWIIAFQHAVGQDKWQAFLWEGFERFRSDKAPKGIPAWFYIQYFAGVMPWTIYFVATLITPFEERFKQWSQPMRFLWLNVVVGLIFLSLPRDKAERYEVPLMASTALLVGQLLSYHWNLWREDRIDPKAKSLWIGQVILMAIAGFAMPAFFVHARWVGSGVGTMMTFVLVAVTAYAAVRMTRRNIGGFTGGLLLYATLFVIAFFMAQNLWSGYHEPLKDKAKQVGAVVEDAPLFSWPRRPDESLVYYLGRLTPVIRDTPFMRDDLPQFAPPSDGTDDPPAVRWLRSVPSPYAYAIVQGDQVAAFQTEMHQGHFTVTQAMDLTTVQPRNSDAMRDPLLLMRVQKSPPAPGSVPDAPGNTSAVPGSQR